MSGWICISCGKQREAPPTFRCPSCSSPLYPLIELDSSRVRSVVESARKCCAKDLNVWSSLIGFDVVMSLGEGGTPLIRISKLGDGSRARLWIKNEFMNPTQTFIDRGAATATSYALLRRVDRIAAAGLGDFLVSISTYARAAGLSTEVFASKSIDVQHLMRLVLADARINLLDSYEKALSHVERLGSGVCSVIPSSGIVAVGYKTIAYEIVAQLGSVPDAVFVPAGDGVLTTSIYVGFQEVCEALGEQMPRLIAVQHGYAPRIVEAVGGLLSRDREDRSLLEVSVEKPLAFSSATEAIRRSGGSAVAVRSSDVVAATVEIARCVGLFVDPVGATAFAGFRRALEEGLVDRSEQVVVIVSGASSKDPYLLYRVVMSDRDSAKSVRELLGADEEVSSTQLDILHALAEEGPQNLCSLWRALRRRGKRVSLSTIHHHVKVLMKMGLVEVIPVEGTARQIYSITEKGLAVLKRYVPSLGGEER